MAAPSLAPDKIQRQGNGWLVPSSTGNGTTYFVQWDATVMKCSCSDFGYRKAREGLPCKHLTLVALAQLSTRVKERKDASVA